MSDTIINRKFFRLIHMIVEQDKIEQSAKETRGELYNIFSILGLSTQEVRLHSAFIGNLLEPKGSHGLGAEFLKAFLETCFFPQATNREIDISTAKINIEFPINGGEIYDDGDRGGRLDILIRDNNNNAIIIENKIYAEDQPKQLLRYWNYIKDYN